MSFSSRSSMSRRTFCLIGLCLFVAYCLTHQVCTKLRPSLGAGSVVSRTPETQTTLVLFQLLDLQVCVAADAFLLDTLLLFRSRSSHTSKAPSVQNGRVNPSSIQAVTFQDMDFGQTDICTWRLSAQQSWKNRDAKASQCALRPTSTAPQ